MNRFFGPHADGADGKHILRCIFRLARIALADSAQNSGNIALVTEGASVDNGYPQPDPNFVDIVSKWHDRYLA